MACFVLTVSDTRTLDDRDERAAIAELLEGARPHRGRPRRSCATSLPTSHAIVREEIARAEVDAIITTGGTGIARRDSTYEALTALFDKRLDGFGELFRMLSFEEIGSAAMLSRASAGVASGCDRLHAAGIPKRRCGWR